MTEQSNEKPNWLRTKSADLEKTIVDLAKEGKSLAEIGLVLRDKHGIPKSKLLGKRVSRILKEAKSTAKTEGDMFRAKVLNLNDHIGKHKHDKKAKRSLIKHGWIIHKLDKKEPGII